MEPERQRPKKDRNPDGHGRAERETESQKEGGTETQRERGGARGPEIGEREGVLRGRVSRPLIPPHRLCPPGGSAQRSAGRAGRRPGAGYSRGYGPGAEGAPPWPPRRQSATRQGRRGRRTHPSSAEEEDETNPGPALPYSGPASASKAPPPSLTLRSRVHDTFPGSAPFLLWPRPHKPYRTPHHLVHHDDLGP